MTVLASTIDHTSRAGEPVQPASDLLAETPAAAIEPPIRLPAAPVPPEPQQFPAIAMIAPMVLGLTLFLIIGSPYLLMFMLFGPVLILAQTIDRKVGGRRRMRRKRAEFAVELERAQEVIAAAHERLRQRARAAHPLARDLLNCQLPPDPEEAVVVGTTVVPSELRIEGGSPGDPDCDRLRRSAEQLAGVPLTVTASAIALCGAEAVMFGAAYALILQRAHQDPSQTINLAGEAFAELAQQLRSWGVAVTWQRHYRPEQAAPVLVAASGSAAGQVADAVTITVRADGGAVVQWPDGKRVAAAVETVGILELRQWLQRVVVPAQRQAHEKQAAIPDSCELAPMLQGGGDRSSAQELAAEFALAASGPLVIDLVRDGPHAVIGGTTGSGKSELLVAWVTALADRYGADACQFLCLDFKGGATFDVVQQLPHCVGIVTDLDEGEALRVLASLQAELRRREMRLRQLQVRDISDARGALARLVVFVDEYQALVSDYPQLAEVFADIGARGRSLGIHLVLCTQRPTGVFRESLLANCALRLSLRVEQPIDSRTLLGIEDAAELPTLPRGRILYRIGSGSVGTAQVARATAQGIAEITARENQRRRSEQLPAIERPWQPSLAADIPQHGNTWATADEPEQQRQWQLPLPKPGEHSWVVGAPKSGKSTALASMARAARAVGRRVRWLGYRAEIAYELLAQLPASPEAGELLLIDDVDALEQQLEEPHRAEFLDRLTRLIRQSAGYSVVLSSSRLTGSLQRLSSLMSGVLRLPTHAKQEWLLNGGENRHYSERFIPGRGRWHELLVQVHSCDSERELQQRAPVSRHSAFEVPEAGCIVIARNAQLLTQWFTDVGYDVGGVPKPGVAAQAAADGQVRVVTGARVLVGDPEQWQGTYGALARESQQLPVLAIGVDPAQWRTLLRDDPLPPPIHDMHEHALWRTPDGRFRRVQLRDGLPWQFSDAQFSDAQFSDDERQDASATRRSVTVQAAH